MTRRAALAGLGAGSLGLAMTSRVIAGPIVANRETGSGPEDSGSASSLSMKDHPLAGLWLAMVKRPSNPAVTVVVPSVFSADGSVMLMFPVAEAAEAGVMLQGVAVGTWEALDEQSAHFTAVQVLCDGEGAFHGSVTIDGYPRVRAGGLTFEDNDEKSLLTIRDSANAIVNTLAGALASNMVGTRMSPGNAGFPNLPPRLTDPRRVD